MKFPLIGNTQVLRYERPIPPKTAKNLAYAADRERGSGMASS